MWTPVAWIIATSRTYIQTQSYKLGPVCLVVEECHQVSHLHSASGASVDEWRARKTSVIKLLCRRRRARLYGRGRGDFLAFILPESRRSPTGRQNNQPVRHAWLSMTDDRRALWSGFRPGHLFSLYRPTAEAKVNGISAGHVDYQRPYLHVTRRPDNPVSLSDRMHETVGSVNGMILARGRHGPRWYRRPPPFIHISGAAWVNSFSGVFISQKFCFHHTIIAQFFSNTDWYMKTVMFQLSRHVRLFQPEAINHLHHVPNPTRGNQPYPSCSKRPDVSNQTLSTISVPKIIRRIFRIRRCLIVKYACKRYMNERKQ